MRLKEPLCLSALEGSHFKMKNGPGEFDKWPFVTSIGPHSILGGGLSIRSGGECGREPFNIFTFLFPRDLQAQ